MFRTMKLRGRKKDCAICGENPTMTELIDYVQFCNGLADDKVSLYRKKNSIYSKEYNLDC